LGPKDRLTAAAVLEAIAERISPDTVVVEEAPSSRPDLHRLLPTRQSLGFLAAATGGLGFAMPAAVGMRLANPRRPVMAVVGDGSSLYAIQSVWSAAHYGIGVLFVVLSNGRYAVMDSLAQSQEGAKGPWPAFEDVNVALICEGFACPSRRIAKRNDLVEALDAAMPDLASTDQPLLLDIQIEVETDPP
jgi:benzoylformate decarboxylase